MGRQPQPSQKQPAGGILKMSGSAQADFRENPHASANRLDLTGDLFLPTLLFTALGGMTWAVRGCAGFGAVPGCLFAGVMWGAGWWYIAHDPTRTQSRRYTSGWIVLALTVGIGLSGERGWMQWPSFFEGKLQTNTGKGEFVAIPRAYGFLWLFIAGVPWAGLGACVLAWCGSLREMRIWNWVARIGFGIGGWFVAWFLYHHHSDLFLPLYRQHESLYKDFAANPNLRRLSNDCGAAIQHMGWYLGFLLYEVYRKDWKNVVLILTVGLLNGAGWALCQNWKWAPGVWKTSTFNFWRCWESSGGLTIGFAYGIAYFLVNRRMSERERAIVEERRSLAGPNFEWLLVYFGLTAFLAFFLQNQMVYWGKYYFSIAILFGAGYYFSRRGKPLKEAGEQPGTVPGGFRIEPIAALLTVALIAGLFAPTILRAAPSYLAGSDQALQRRYERAVGFGNRRANNPPNATATSSADTQDADLPWVGTLKFASQNLMFYTPAVMGLGIGWFLVRRATFEQEKLIGTPTDGDPNLERWGLYLGLLTGLGLSIRNGLKGWCNIYLGNENYWSRVLWQYLGPVFLVCLIAIAVCVLKSRVPRTYRGPVFPHAYGLIWLVLIVQNVIAQLITGPLTEWNEMAFSIYYILLFFITAAIVAYYHLLKTIERLTSELGAERG
jgi:hypothetical protein